MSATAKFRRQHAEILEIAKTVNATLARLPEAAGEVRGHSSNLAAK